MNSIEYNCGCFEIYEIKDLVRPIAKLLENRDWLSFITTCKSFYEDLWSEAEVKKRTNHLMKIIEMYPDKEWDIEDLLENPLFNPFKSPFLEKCKECAEFAMNSHVTLAYLKENGLDYSKYLWNPNARFSELDPSMYELEGFMRIIPFDCVEEILNKGTLTIDGKDYTHLIYCNEISCNRCLVDSELLLLYEGTEWECMSFLCSYKFIEKHLYLPWEFRVIFRRLDSIGFIRKIWNKEFDKDVLSKSFNNRLVMIKNKTDGTYTLEKAHNFINRDNVYRYVMQELRQNYSSQIIEREELEKNGEKYSWYYHILNPHLDIREFLNMPDGFDAYCEKHGINNSWRSFCEHSNRLCENESLTWDIVRDYEGEYGFDFGRMGFNRFRGIQHH